MLNTSIIQAISDSVLCWLATSSADGQPNVSPKEIFTNHGSDMILIAHIMSPQSIKNIKANPLVAVSFIDILKQKGFQLKGIAAIIKKQDPLFNILHEPLFKIAGPQYPIISIIQIKINAVKPILAPRYILFPDTTEEEQIISARKTYKLI